MKIPENLKYSKTHEWIKVEDNKGYVGISDYGQDALGEIVYVEIPEVDTEVEKGEEACTIESVKAASSVYSPVTGKIIEGNGSLEDNPENINKDPYENYIFVVQFSDSSELDSLLSADEYKEELKKEED